MASTEVRRQDSDHWVFRRSVLASELSVGLLRGYAETVLTKWGLATQVEDAKVVVSELATNAVKARSGPKRRITLRISLLSNPSLILVEMTDPFPGRPEFHEATALDESGRGLMIIRMLAKDCGYREESNGGKTAWATLRTINKGDQK